VAGEYEYLPPGDAPVVVAHNHIRPDLDPFVRDELGLTDMSHMPHGLNGFRARLDRADNPRLEVCDCPWARDLLDTHYRVRPDLLLSPMSP
jgi:hypothetical protein